MTAEITIMNRSAIALAADSAVTVRGNKVYNSANKLFMLSKYFPVGIMIYQNASFMSIPWETIIKSFRRELGNDECNTLKEYEERLIRFIESHKILFNENLQNKIFKINVKDAFKRIKAHAENKYAKLQLENIATALKNKSELQDPNQSLIFKEVIESEHERFEKYGEVDNLKSLKVQDLILKYDALLNECIAEAFQKSPIDDNLKKKLKEIAVYYFLKDHSHEDWSDNFTGIVIAGFGRDEYVPSYIHLKAENIFENKLKYNLLEVEDVDHTGGACIRFFAQTQMGTFFMRGIEENLDNYSKRRIYEKLIEFRNEILQKLTLEDKEKKTVSDSVDELIKKKISDYNSDLQGYIQDKSVMPILSTVGSLPKDELAAMAESLVNLASFKKRVSGEKESVGGPIDVAVISKGDGFVWIKRKHYFNLELNPHFRENYYKGDKYADQTPQP